MPAVIFFFPSLSISLENISRQDFLVKGSARNSSRMEAVFHFLQEYRRRQLFLINLQGFFLLKALLGREVKEGCLRWADRHTACLFQWGWGDVYTQLLLLWFLAGHHRAISRHGCPHHRRHPHVCRMLLWVWFGEETATETPRRCAQVSSYRPGVLDAALPGDVTWVKEPWWTGSGCPPGLPRPAPESAHGAWRSYLSFLGLMNQKRKSPPTPPPHHQVFIIPAVR